MKLYPLFFFLAFYTLLQGEIVQTSSLQEVEDRIQELSADDLLIACWENGLAVSENSAFFPSTMKKHKTVLSALTSTWPQELFDAVQHVAFSVSPQIVDESAPSILNEAEANGVPVFFKSEFLPKAMKGDFLAIANFKRLLNKAGLEAGENYPYVSYSQCKRYLSCYPCSAQGMLLTNGTKTSLASLIPLLCSSYDLQPRIICVISGNKKELEKLEKQYDKVSENFLGIYLTAAREISAKSSSPLKMIAEWKKVEQVARILIK